MLFTSENKGGQLEKGKAKNKQTNSFSFLSGMNNYRTIEFAQLPALPIFHNQHFGVHLVLLTDFPLI